MRFTELERSLLATNAALVARLDLIEQGDDLADSIAERSCKSCKAALKEAYDRANQRETVLIDELADLRRDRDLLFSLVTALDWNDSVPREIKNAPEWLAYARVSAEWMAKAKDAAKEFGRIVDTPVTAEPTEPKPLQLEVGKKYRRRDGEVVTVHSYDDDVYPFHGGECSYTPGGVWHVGRQNPLDLIAEVTEEAAEVAA
jgi:hypothetical protein